MKTCFRRKDLKMTKRVNRRLFHTALAFAAVCALTVPSMTIRADKTAEAGEGAQTALAAVQEEAPGIRAATGYGGCYSDNRSGRGFGKLCFTASEHPGYSADPA